MPTINDLALAIYGVSKVLGPRCCKHQDIGRGTLDLYGGYYCRNCGGTVTLEKVVRVKVKRPPRLSMKDLAGEA